MGKYVGLSVSFCISAILSGKVKTQQVEFIVPGFNWTGEVPELYFNSHWRHRTRAEVEAIVSQLRFVNKPKDIQINIARGIWWPHNLWDWSVLEDPNKRMMTESIIETRPL